MDIRWCDFHGQPAVALQTSWGDRATVLLHGAQIVSWQTSDGVEHLYCSDQARLNGQDAVRAGVPVCFPQFNQRGPLMKHGFARHMPWQLREAQSDRLCFVLRDGVLTKQLWPHAFLIELELILSPNGLRLGLRVDNTDLQPWPFTCALHTYLRVPDVTNMELQGLAGAAVWDAVQDAHGIQAQSLRFGSECDRVFQARSGQMLRLQSVSAAGTADASGPCLQITQSDSCLQTVVWNPGSTLCQTLSDMPPEGWREMLCVEAACIDTPVLLAPQHSWQAWQMLQWSAGA